MHKQGLTLANMLEQIISTVKSSMITNITWSMSSSEFVSPLLACRMSMPVLCVKYHHTCIYAWCVYVHACVMYKITSYMHICMVCICTCLRYALSYIIHAYIHGVYMSMPVLCITLHDTCIHTWCVYVHACVTYEITSYMHTYMMCICACLRYV